jgi:hypothetical protein
MLQDMHALRWSYTELSDDAVILQKSFKIPTFMKINSRIRIRLSEKQT